MTNISGNDEKHIGTLLKRKILHVQINPSHCCNESNIVSSQRTVSATLNKYEEAGDPKDELQNLKNAVMILRRVIQRTSHSISKVPLMILNFKRSSTSFADGLYKLHIDRFAWTL